MMITVFVIITCLWLVLDLNRDSKRLPQMIRRCMFDKKYHCLCIALEEQKSNEERKEMCNFACSKLKGIITCFMFYILLSGI